MQPLLPNISKYLDNSLEEDIRIGGDITSNAVIPSDKTVKFCIRAREALILAGMPIAEYFLSKYSRVNYKTIKRDEEEVTAGQDIIEGEGAAREILLLERTILNYLQHLSGIATLTRQYVAKTAGTKAKICDTRKTIPGLRTLQKYAVRCGRGHNHRLALDSGILIKDNHIAICGSVTKSIELARLKAPHYMKIEVECDSLEQVREALGCNVDIIMLDNMSLEQIKEALEIIAGRSLVEVSGGVDLGNVEAIARTGVDLISIGRLTHSARAVDIGLDIG